MDIDGNAVAVWTQYDGTGGSIWANRFVPGMGWGRPELIETDDLGHAFDPQVSMDPAGSVVAVWHQDDGTRDDIWANRGMGNVPPALVITSPLDGAVLPSSLVTVTGTASDNVGLDEVALSLDGTTYDVTTGTTSWSGTLNLAEGPNTIFARATDLAGNMATVSIAVTVDTVKPRAVAGDDQTSNAGATISFDASASSDNVAIASYRWEFGDGGAGTGQTTIHVYVDPGIYTVTLTIQDAAGNADTDVLIVTVESAPVNPIPSQVVTFGVVGAIAAAAAGVAFLLWRRRAGGKEKA